MYLKWLSHTLQFKSNCDGPQIMHHWFCFLFYRNSCFMCSKAVMSWIFWFPFFITWTMLDLTSVRMPLSSFYHIYDSHANYIKSPPHFPDRPAVACIYNVHNVKKNYWDLLVLCNCKFFLFWSFQKFNTFEYNLRC